MEANKTYEIQEAPETYKIPKVNPSHLTPSLWLQDQYQELT